MLIHSVYSSSQISERGNKKLFGLSLKHTSLSASWEKNLLLCWGEDCLIKGIPVQITQKRGHVYFLNDVFEMVEVFCKPLAMKITEESIYVQS